jgi:hypothetical protein
MAVWLMKGGGGYGAISYESNLGGLLYYSFSPHQGHKEL